MNAILVSESPEESGKKMRMFDEIKACGCGTSPVVPGDQPSIFAEDNERQHGQPGLSRELGRHVVFHVLTDL